MISPFQALEMLGEEEYSRRVRGERRPPGPGGIVLVGERANNSSLRDSPPWPAAATDSRIRRGAFLWGASRDRLTGLGLRWDAAMNLLDPLPRLEAPWGATDKIQARANGLHFMLTARERGWRAILAGSRVAWACGAEFEPLAVGELHAVQALVIPHPSGLSRWWNDAGNSAAARELFAKLRDSDGQPTDWRRLG